MTDYPDQARLIHCDANILHAPGECEFCDLHGPSPRSSRRSRGEFVVNMIRATERRVSLGEWPGGLSDGLVLPYLGCKRRPVVDYRVTDEAWKRVTGRLAPEIRLGVVCIDCFIWFGGEPEDVTSIQVTGSGQTLVALLSRLYRYKVGG